MPQVIEAVAAAVPRGLRLPIVYNTSAYDSVASLRLLDGIVDIYMPDFKFWEPETVRRLAKAKDYPDRAREAIREMHRQVGELKFGRDGCARGVLVRHLVMPGQSAEAEAIFRWLAKEVSRDTYVNIMGQYRPTYEVGPKKIFLILNRFAEIDRRPREATRSLGPTRRRDRSGSGALTSMGRDNSACRVFYSVPPGPPRHFFLSFSGVFYNY